MFHMTWKSIRRVVKLYNAVGKLYVAIPLFVVGGLELRGPT